MERDVCHPLSVPSCQMVSGLNRGHGPPRLLS
jgi:hypothetical protein